MGKNRNIESLIRLITNTIVHEIVAKHTNRPESKSFLDSEIVEYGGQTKRTAELHNWNSEDKEHIKEKSLKKIKEKLAFKYPDISFSIKEVEKLLDEKINELL